MLGYAMLLDLLTVAVLGLVGFRLVTAARTAVGNVARARTREIVSGLRRRHFLRAPLVLIGVLIVASGLWLIPPLRFGWWTALGGTGNIVVGSTSRTEGTPLVWLVPAIFLILLFPALPLFAEREELMFRRGAENWSTARRAWQGLKFGLVHLVMGIPIAVALALSVGGWYFTWAYLRGYRETGSQAGAVMESTRTHLAYNSVILGFVGLVLAGSLLPACRASDKPPVSKSMSLTSPAFPAEGAIPTKYSCSGDNVSPPLVWSGAPVDSAAIAIVVQDPDAPGGNFTHWIITGIDPRRTSLGEGERPPGVREGRASDGKDHYVGPCPPPGKPHHYRFTVYALRRATAPSIDAIVANASSQGRLVGTFAR